MHALVLLMIMLIITDIAEWRYAYSFSATGGGFDAMMPEKTQLLRLAFLKRHSRACVIQVVEVLPGYRQRMSCFGLEPGATVQVVHRAKMGAMVILVGQFLFAIDRQLADAVFVEVPWGKCAV